MRTWASLMLDHVKRTICWCIHSRLIWVVPFSVEVLTRSHQSTQRTWTSSPTISSSSRSPSTTTTGLSSYFFILTCCTHRLFLVCGCSPVLNFSFELYRWSQRQISAENQVSFFIAFTDYCSTVHTIHFQPISACWMRCQMQAGNRCWPIQTHQFVGNFAVYY